MYQSSFLSPTPVQSLTPMIAELIDDVNTLLEQVSPGVDYRIDPDTGVILGKRQKPSLSGEPSYDHAPIGWLAINDQGAVIAAEYFKNESFSSHIHYVRSLYLTKRQERIDNLNSPDTPINLYEKITVACVFEELIVEAFVAELEERGFVVETVSVRNWTKDSSPLASIHCPQPALTMLRGSRDKFVQRWSGLLKGTDFATVTHQPWQQYQPGALNYAPQDLDQQPGNEPNHSQE